MASTESPGDAPPAAPREEANPPATSGSKRGHSARQALPTESIQVDDGEGSEIHRHVARIRKSDSTPEEIELASKKAKLKALQLDGQFLAAEQRKASPSSVKAQSRQPLHQDKPTKRLSSQRVSQGQHLKVRQRLHRSSLRVKTLTGSTVSGSEFGAKPLLETGLPISTTIHERKSHSGRIHCL